MNALCTKLDGDILDKIRNSKKIKGRTTARILKDIRELVGETLREVYTKAKSDINVASKKATIQAATKNEKSAIRILNSTFIDLIDTFEREQIDEFMKRFDAEIKQNINFKSYTSSMAFANFERLQVDIDIFCQDTLDVINDMHKKIEADMELFAGGVKVCIYRLGRKIMKYHEEII